MPTEYVETVDTEAHSLMSETGIGRTNERIGRIQETYVAEATTSWLESLERSMVQMKEYQVSDLLDEPLRFLSNTIEGCSQKAGKSTAGLRYFSSQNAEGQERGLSSRGGAAITEGKI